MFCHSLQASMTIRTASNCTSTGNLERVLCYVPMLALVIVAAVTGGDVSRWGSWERNATPASVHLHRLRNGGAAAAAVWTGGVLIHRLRTLSHSPCFSRLRCAPALDSIPSFSVTHHSSSLPLFVSYYLFFFLCILFFICHRERDEQGKTRLFARRKVTW